METIYTTKDQMIYDAVARNDGSLLAGLGGTGRLLGIDAAKQVTVVTDSPMEQATRLISDGDTVWVAGSNQGKVYKLSSQRAQDGTYVSKSLDAKTVASWGRIMWRYSGSTPAWRSPHGPATRRNPTAHGAIGARRTPTPSGQQITSPKARYLQWRATFKRGAAAAQRFSWSECRLPTCSRTCAPRS